MKISFISFVLFICFREICGVVQFKYLRGRRFDRYVGFRTKVPTLYQCAQICQTLKMCMAINFDLTQTICYVSTQPWSEISMSVNANFVFANKVDIPQEIAPSCLNHVCGENEICSSGKCHPVYQCLDGSLPSTTCEYWERYGGCDENNIGKVVANSIIWKYENFIYLFYHCKRTCKLCP